MTDKTFKDYLKEDAIDQEKHDALNNIAMTLGALETEIQELQRLDGDMDSTGVGDLTDQLTTMRKLVNSFEDVIDRATGVVPMESVNEAVDQALIDQVVDQIMRDIEMGDQTAIEELLKSCPEVNLRGFLSEVKEADDDDEDENDDLFKDDEFTAMDQEDDDEVNKHFERMRELAGVR